MSAPTSVTFQDLLLAAPKLEVQLVLVLIQAILWHWVIFRALPPYIRVLIESLERKDQFFDLNKRMFKTICQIDFGDDKGLLVDYTLIFNGIMVQHFFGACLCLPAVLGWRWVSPPVASALACHGAICEVGWEIQDSAVRLKELLFDGELGRKKNPAGYLLVNAIHHSCALCLVLPLNLHYRDCPHYHEAIFLLQASVAVSLSCQQLGFTLDVGTRRGLRLMQVLVTVVFAAFLWGRLLRYGYLWSELLGMFHADGNFFMLRLAMAPLVLMSLFNILLVVDSFQKFHKFVLCRGSGAVAEGARQRVAGQQDVPVLLGSADTCRSTKKDT